MVVELVQSQIASSIRFREAISPGLIIWLIILEVIFSILTVRKFLLHALLLISCVTHMEDKGVAIALTYKLRREISGQEDDDNEYHELL